MPPSRIGGHAGHAPFSRRERERENKRRGCACYEKDTPIAADITGEIKVCALARGDERLDPLIARTGKVGIIKRATKQRRAAPQRQYGDTTRRLDLFP